MTLAIRRRRLNLADNVDQLASIDENANANLLVLGVLP